MTAVILTSSLKDECFRQSENCAYTSTSFIIWLRVLRWTRTVFWVAPVVCGAIATAKIVAQTSPISAAVFSLLATVIPLAYRATQIDHVIEDYELLAGEFTNLRDRFRQAATVSSQKPFPEFEAEVKPLIDRLEKARHRSLAPPEWCFLLARRKHKANHYQHNYDENLPIASNSG
jgi:hypothetical protein